MKKKDFKNEKQFNVFKKLLGNYKNAKQMELQINNNNQIKYINSNENSNTEFNKQNSSELEYEEKLIFLKK